MPLTQEQTSLLDLDLLRDRCRYDLFFFAKAILGFDWLDKDIHLPLCIALEEKRSREVFVLPRGWLKTTLCSIAEPIWDAVNNPDLRTLIVQNSHNNAKKKLEVIRRQFESNNLLRAMYAHLLPDSSCIWSVEALCLKRPTAYSEATFECAGLNTKVISRHYDKIIEDDTVAPDTDELGEESLAPTHDDVQKAIGWHKLATNLLTNPPLDAPVQDRLRIVGTRWYEEDLISWIEAHEKQYRIHKRSCRENAKGESDPRGQVTYPTRFDEQKLDELEAANGPYMFSCLYYNLPVRTGDMIFQADWVQYYEELPPLKSLVYWTSVDAATDPELSTQKNGDLDYSTVLTACKDLMTGDVYVVDYFRKRCNPGEHLGAIMDHVTKYHPIKVIFDNVNYQRSIQYWAKNLMRKTGHYFIMEGSNRSGSKTSKPMYIMGLQPMFANKVIWLRPWMKELVSELLTFPRGRHDDLIDTLAMQTQSWKQTKSKHEGKAVQGYDPLSFDAAVEAIRGNLDKKSIVMSPMDCMSTSYSSLVFDIPALRN